ncbi:hypothetical protein [Pandoraea faecigallinarum]|nr:hypothetical protein [Pandoraea faecigallinarum]
MQHVAAPHSLPRSTFDPALRESAWRMAWSRVPAPALASHMLHCA